ncbi:MAG: hypothetical protein JST80_04885 [Bdellovibrionales bacterium]|nr:hypothetical protein [Bdellovibrionales bacterium]
MDGKAKKKYKKSTLIDPFTKRLLVIMFITVPILGYLILKPNEQRQTLAIEQTKQFAQFIETKPELAQPKREPSSEQHAPPPPARPVLAQQTEPQQEPTVFDPNTALTVDDRIEINNMSSQWNQVDFVRNHVWRDQVEQMFSIAERTRSPDVFDLLRRQVILGKVDEDQSNRIRSETWFERYMKVEQRPVPRKEMEDLFMNSNN